MADFEITSFAYIRCKSSKLSSTRNRIIVFTVGGDLLFRSIKRKGYSIDRRDIFDLRKRSNILFSGWLKSCVSSIDSREEYFLPSGEKDISMIGLSVMSPRSIEENIFTIELNVERLYDRSGERECFFNLNGIFFYRRERYFYGPILSNCIKNISTIDRGRWDEKS